MLRQKCPYLEFFWSVFSRIRTKYREMRSISSHSVRCSVRMRENTDQKNSEYKHFSHSTGRGILQQYLNQEENADRRRNKHYRKTANITLQTTRIQQYFLSPSSALTVPISRDNLPTFHKHIGSKETCLGNFHILMTRNHLNR